MKIKQRKGIRWMMQIRCRIKKNEDANKKEGCKQDGEWKLDGGCKWVGENQNKKKSKVLIRWCK